MSKRPKTTKRFFVSLRRPFGRPRDMPIWSKLALIMIVPTIATAVVGINGLMDHYQTYSDADRAGTLAHLSQASGDLVNQLQDERAAAVLLLGATEPQAKQRYRTAFDKLHPDVDRAKVPYSQRRGELDELPANFNELLNRIDQGLGDLPATRSQITNAKVLLVDAVQAYETLIVDLLDMRDSAAQLAANPALGDRMRSAAAIARSKEFLSMRRVVVHRAIIHGALSPSLRTEFIGTEQGQQQALQNFKSVASGVETQLYDQTVSGSDQREAETYSGWVRSKPTETMKFAPFSADEWDAAMVRNAKLIRTVEAKLDADLVAEASQVRSDVQRQVLIETGVLIGMLILGIVLALMLARSMARSLRELKHGALSIAEHGLPHAVARLRDPQLSAQLSPVQLANQIAEPLPVRGKDEFGQVTEAFNAVHLEAVRTAAEQAALRSSVSTMFVNLARRSQILVDRLIGHLDRLERGEEDPDRLAELFQLDHLATRMRRNDENLLVLAGADSTRVQRQPAALIDVLRAAQSEVEHYTRIEFGMVDRDIEVAAHAVNDLVHLVAELFDNATAFSPPDSHVMVEARRVGDRASLYVEDRGIGMSADQLAELNERLATPPMVDVAVSRMMGLVVVARLADRHGVHVELRPGTDRGTVADVTLPTSVLVPRALSGRVQHPGAFPALPETQPAASPAPLALESGQFGAAPQAGERGPVPGAPDQWQGTPAGSDSRPFERTSPAGPTSTERPAPTRPMPAWSDLTGVKLSREGAAAFVPKPAAGRENEPLPQRRASADGDATGTIPRQIPVSPEAQPAGAFRTEPTSAPIPGPPVVSAPPVVSSPPVTSAPPVTSGPPWSAAPSGTAYVGAPPAWPPVAVPEPEVVPAAASERDAAAPVVPERLAAALDLTAEMPRVPRNPTETPVSGQPAVPANEPRYVDETMELPIFRELESAWFRTRRPAPEEPGGSTPPGFAAVRAATTPTTRFAMADATRSGGQDTSTGATGNAATADTPTSTGQRRGSEATVIHQGTPGGRGDASVPRWGDTPSGGWQTAADDGWRAATAATDVSVTETTQTGLPKRVPMAQLVPGGVEKPAASVQRRSPEAVRGLLAAYHRGVQRGRTRPTDDHSTNPEATPGGQSSQSGSGFTVRSRQKEHEG
ncbi:nitrate- and nitrite sensing domain-containing protein [Micromonospora sp. NPDC003197]